MAPGTMLAPEDIRLRRAGPAACKRMRPTGRIPDVGLKIPLVVGLAALAAAGAAEPVRQAAVRFEPLELDKAWAGAIEPGSLGYACASAPSQLPPYFQDRQLPFDGSLVRSEGGRACHVFYEPTLPGFIVDVDNQPIQELFSDVETANLLSRRSKRIGDSLDMLKAMLPLIPRPLDIHLGVVQSYDEDLFDSARAFHFPGSQHRIRFRSGETDAVSPWVQDYLKSGTAGGSRRILVTRLLYEGAVENGVLFRPLLDSLREERFVRSKLSWEGGDLQFVGHPRHPGRRVLVYGNAGKNYWARQLSPEEYRYVLKLEFGADDAIRLSDLAPHVDYFVSFLPADDIALVSEPERNNLPLARAALQALRERYGDGAPPALAELERLLSLSDAEIQGRAGTIRGALERAEKSAWPEQQDPQLAARIGRYAERHCPADVAECMSLEGRRRMLAEDPGLFRDWTTAGWEAKSQSVFVPYSLALVKSQLPGFPNRMKERIEEKVREIQAFGFRVIRVPRVSGEADLGLTWAGISYANNLLVDNLLFVPAFGLGAAEQAIFDRLERELPERYTVVPIYSRHMILYNGGVHCIVGIVRAPADGRAGSR